MVDVSEALVGRAVLRCLDRPDTVLRIQYDGKIFTVDDGDGCVVNPGNAPTLLLALQRYLAHYQAKPA